jgi:hypothetical protein
MRTGLERVRKRRLSYPHCDQVAESNNQLLLSCVFDWKFWFSSGVAVFLSAANFESYVSLTGSLFAAAAIRLRLRLLQYFSLYGLQLQQSKQLQQCRLAASRTRPGLFWLYVYMWAGSA